MKNDLDLLRNYNILQGNVPKKILFEGISLETPPRGAP
jgi:hypothetical protein